MTIHEQSTKDLKRQVADGALSPKKEAMAEAVLRHRRAARIRDWLGRHAWMGAVVALFGLARFLSSSRKQHKGH
jgi:hypothetical protein